MHLYYILRYFIKIDLKIFIYLYTILTYMQATINIGTLGHVSHGKSTLVQALTGIKPMKHSKEKQLSLTIKLGYANFKLFNCPNCNHYQHTQSYLKQINCKTCDSEMDFSKHISLVDSPGHHSLMATMMSGAAVMDAVILVIAADKSVPQPQTSEHLAVADMLGIDNLIIVQNKVDLVSKDKAKKNYEEILEFVKGTVAEGKPIIPVSCAHHLNIDVVMECLDKYIKEPERETNKYPLMDIVRSFDINKPGTEHLQLKGGVLGGSLKYGQFKVGQKIEIKPGIMVNNELIPLKSEIISLYSEKNKLTEANCGGLIAIGTNIDPSFTKNDLLQGQVIGLQEHMPNVYQKINVKFRLMKYLASNEDKKIGHLREGEVLRCNCGSLTTCGKVLNKEKHIISLKLDKHVCLIDGDYIALSRKIDGAWRLIGCGIFIEGYD
jgi:translation initiation factor 2 subunit 3